jgi:hypothetical protein
VQLIPDAVVQAVDVLVHDLAEEEVVDIAAETNATDAHVGQVERSRHAADVDCHGQSIRAVADGEGLLGGSRVEEAPGWRLAAALHATTVTEGKPRDDLRRQHGFEHAVGVGESLVDLGAALLAQVVNAWLHSSDEGERGVDGAFA